MVAAMAVLIVARYAAIMLPGDGRTPIETQPQIERGPILDRRGRILAIQTRLDTVTAWKPEMENIEETAGILADILVLNPLLKW